MNQNLLLSRRVRLFVLALGILLSCWMWTTFQLHYDHWQILSKVHKLLVNGEWTHYGNRGTGVGYVPGTLLTALAAGPMAIWYSPYSAMAVILLFHFLCLLCFYFPIKRVFGETAAFLFLVLYWLNPWRIEQVELYNPAYLFLFSGIHFYSALKLNKHKCFWYSGVHVLALILCAQIHFSAIILCFASLLLWVFRMVKINWYGVLAGSALGALTLLPYFLSVSGDPSQGIQVETSSGFVPGKNLILIYPLVKAVLYWLRYGSFYFARHIFTTVHFLWIEGEGLRAVASALFHIVKWPVGIATLLGSIMFQWKFLRDVWIMKPFRRISRLEMDYKTWIFHYAFYLFLGMLAAAGLSPVEFNHWHLILCFPTVVLLVSVGAAKWLEMKGWFNKAAIAVIIYFTLYGTIMTLGSKMHDVRTKSYHEQVLEKFPL